MFAEQRQEKIVHMLQEYKQVDVNSLTTLLSASEATIRRDLEKLEKAGLLHRTHGGAILAEEERSVLQTITKKANPQETIFESIGKTAARIVEPNEVIAIGAGMLGLSLAKNLNSTLECTIITNDAGIMTELLCRQQQNVIMIGGPSRKIEQTVFTSGEAAIHMLDEFHVNKAFLTVDGVHIDAGLTIKTLDYALIWKKLKSIANETVIMAVPEAFGQREFVRLMPVTSAHRYISCVEMGEKYKKHLFDLNIPVHFSFDV